MLYSDVNRCIQKNYALNIRINKLSHIASYKIKNECISLTVIECSGAIEIENGSFELINNNETVFGTTVRYSCKPGYKLVGPRQITCLANEQYDALPPTCQGTVTFIRTL